MLFFDALIRFSAATMLLLLAFTAVRDLRGTRSWPYLTLASLSTAALFLSLSSNELLPPRWIAFTLGFSNVPHLVLVWLFALSIYQTGFRLSCTHIAVGAAYTFPIFWFRAFQFGMVTQPPFALSVAVSIGSIAMMVHLIWVIFVEHGDDLILARQQSRFKFVCVLCAVTVITAALDLYLISVWPDQARLLKAAAIWPGVVAATFWIIGPRSNSLFVANQSNMKQSEDYSGVSPSDLELYRALRSHMSEHREYLDAKLTIANLAQKLGTNSHRLRSLINQSLGFENFNQFLNAERIQAVVEKLDDPRFDHVPILTIAFESGFSSLSPFNRAFKEMMGQTPSQYRKASTRSRS